MRGRSIPKSVLKSGVKLPEMSKSASIPSDLHKTTTTTTATATVVVSSQGPTPQEELDACRPLLSLSDNLFIKTDRRRGSPVTKRHYDVEIHCEEKNITSTSSSTTTDHRERGDEGEAYQVREGDLAEGPPKVAVDASHCVVQRHGASRGA